MNLKFVLTVFIVLALAIPFAWNTGNVFAESACDSLYITQTGMTTTKPTAGQFDIAIAYVVSPLFANTPT